MRVSEYFTENSSLDQPAARLDEVTRTVVGDVRGPRAAAWRGEALGHPLHPLLTDLPIGFWTSAFTLDLVGGRRGRKAARRLTGLGVAVAVPTIVAGLAEFATIDDQQTRRVAVAHAASNGAATTIFALSWWTRRRHPIGGALLGAVAATVATVGGMLGGDLAYPAPSQPALDGHETGSEADRPGQPADPELTDTPSPLG